MQIDPTARAAGMRHIAYEKIGSTNAEALARARAGEHGPLWITASSQDGGRGRRGSAWVSAPGNLFATLLLSEPSPIEFASQLSFVAALAVHDAVTGCSSQLGPLTQLKWPNDVLVGGKKIAGLLIEGGSDTGNSVAIGIGINCVSHPVQTAYPATDLAVEGVLVTTDALFGVLTAAMVRRLAQWQAGTAFASIRADWLMRAAGVGEPIRVRLQERELEGLFHGLDDTGRLLVVRAGGAVAAITAGEVFSLGAGAER